MKQLLSNIAISMMLAAVLAACSDETGTTSRGEYPPVRFGVGRTTTRTASNTLTIDGSGANELSLKSEGFGVFACYTGIHPYVSTSITCNLMWNQQVTYDNTQSVWTYAPLAYWPTTDNEDEVSYATFYAYAPYSDATDPYGCIVDFSYPGETGDPWLTYQLGGTMYADGANGWKTKQADLLYDMQKDQQRPVPPHANKVNFSFKHALSCVGDRITVTCSDALQSKLKSLYTSSQVTLTLNKLRLDYLLTRKGRLVLNSSIQPNWQPVESGDARVHRLLVLNPEHIIATATSASVCTLTDYAVNDQGIFYIPIEVGANAQTVTATADYTFSTGETGQISTTINLSTISNAGNGRNLNLVLDF